METRTPARSLRLIRILVAEDDEDHLFLTVRALRDLEGVSLEVDAVHDGDEALDFVYGRGRFAGRPRPHLVILDLKMPKVDGLEVLARLKSDRELRTIPIVVLSASERSEDVEAAYRYGTNSYVPKRRGLLELREVVDQMSDYWIERAVLPEPPP